MMGEVLSHPASRNFATVWSMIVFHTVSMALGMVCLIVAAPAPKAEPAVAGQA